MKFKLDKKKLLTAIFSGGLVVLGTYIAMALLPQANTLGVVGLVTILVGYWGMTKS